MDLPVMPPVSPMLAKSVKEIPDGPGYLYEPKWDGFRCIVFRDGDEVELGSRNERPLTRYFPEVVARGQPGGGLGQHRLHRRQQRKIHTGQSSSHACIPGWPVNA